MSGRADNLPADVIPRCAVPTRYERIPALASAILGGPVGRYAAIGRRGWYPAAAVLSSLSSVFIALSVLQRNHCISKGWATPGSLWHYCYSDLPVAVAGPAGSHPWDSVGGSAAPPLTSIVTWLVRILVPDGSQLRLQQGMFAIGAAVIAACIAAAVCFLASAMPRGPWAAAHVALSPVLFTAALTSFDALAAMLAAGSLWAFSRRRPAWAGAFAAAAGLARPQLFVLLVALLLIDSKRTDRQELKQDVLGALGVCAVVLVPMFLLADDPLRPLTNWAAQGANYGSAWFLFGLAGVRFSSDMLTMLGLLGWLLALVLGYVLVRFEEVEEPAAVALAMLLMVLFFGRALPLQAALWVLPLVAACVAKWRDHLIWAAAEFAYFLVLWPFVARASNEAKALPDGWFAAISILRLAGWLYLVFALLRRHWSTDSSRHAVAGRIDRSGTTPSTPHV